MTEQAAWRIVARGIFLVFALILLALLARELQTVIVQLLLASLLAAAMSPAVDRLTRSRRIGRGVAALAVLLGATLLLGLISVAVFSTAVPDLVGLVTNAPTYLQRVQSGIEDLAAANPEVAARVAASLPSLSDIAGPAMSVVTQTPGLLRAATGVFGTALRALFTLFLALYLTIDGERIRRYLIRFLPPDRQDQALRVTEGIGMRLGAWARGEALLGVIVGGMTWLGATVIGLPYAAALALIAGIGELIPTLGPIIAAVPLVAVGLLASPLQGLLALGLSVLVQQSENNIIVPRVMSHAVDLHPVAVMLAVLAGGELLGIPGALIAVPVAAALSVIVDEFQRERESHTSSCAQPCESSPDQREVSGAPSPSGRGLG